MTNVARQPFLGLALAAAIGIVLADCIELSPLTIIWMTVASVIFASLLLCRPSLILTYLLVGLAFYLLHSFRTTDTAGLRLAARLTDRPRPIGVNGLVVSEPRIAPSGFATLLLKLNSIQLEGKNEPSDAKIAVRWRGQPQFGDELNLFGIAEPIGPPRNPGEFDLRSYRARQDVRRSLFVRYAEQGTIVRRTGGNFVLRAAQRSRDWMVRALSYGLAPDPQIQDLISGISLVVRQETPNDIEDLFQQTGTLHLFAVSGLNVAIIGQLLWVLGILARIPRRWIIAFIIPALAFYATITGLQTSSVRAAVMSSVLLAGFFVERKVFAFNSLAAAAFFILAWNTNQLFSVGFQLSFAVVFAILLLAEPIFLLIRPWGSSDPFLPRTLLRGPRRWLDASFVWLCRGASVSLAAWLGSLFLIYWNFHLVTPISLFANLVVVPIAFLILAIAMLSLLCMPLLPWLTVIFNHANWLLAHLLLGAVSSFAQIPGGHFYAERPHFPRGEPEITVLDAGVGGAVHLRNHHRDWLFDCGSDRDYHRLLREYLHARGVDRLNGLLLTHGDSLHIGAAGSVLNDFSPKLLVDNPVLDRSAVHRRLRSAFTQLGITVENPTAGTTISLSPELRANVLFPPSGFDAARVDDQTFVIQLLLPSSVHVLLVSDSGEATEQALLTSGVDLRSDILIKGQHHSGRSGTDAFLAAVHPQLIIATSRDFPDRERITDEWMQKVQAMGIKLFRQNETGAVELQFRRDYWEARGYVNGEVFRSSNR